MHTFLLRLGAPMALAFACVVAAPPAAAASPSAPLPHGIHLARNGRYTQDVCDHDAAFHCAAGCLLVPGYKPGLAPDLVTCAIEPGPPAGTMTPSDILAAYSVPASSAAGGQIVAIEDMPDSAALADVNVYRAHFGIPELPQCAGPPSGNSPCFAVVDQDGNLDPTGLADAGGDDTETSLDMDMISTVCPDCSILLVEFTSPQGPNAQDLLTAARTAQSLGAVATGISWTGAETGNDPTGFTQPGKMLVLAASGDTGYMHEERAGGTPGYPASAPDVLGVGGTTLRASRDGYTEEVWNYWLGMTSSGCSTEFGMPAFQTAYLATHPLAFGSCSMRANNDLSAAAEFLGPGADGFGGFAVYASSQGGWSAQVGTSAATQEATAILVRLGLARRISSDLGFVYENAAAFFDVTSGTNDDGDGICTDVVLCNAGPGWDGPTGVGTPNGAALAAFGGESSQGAPAKGAGCAMAAGTSVPGGTPPVGLLVLAAVAVAARGGRRRRPS